MRKLKKLMLRILLPLFCLVNVVYGQNKMITGIVTGVNDQPLPGVTVTVKGTKINSLTDGDGVYSIKASQGATLVFTSAGYVKKEIMVGSTSAINIVLANDERELGEVVVTAFGITKQKRMLSTSTQTINNEDIIQGQRDNFLNALNGRVAGATINATSGAPGASSQIVLRGINSLSNTNSPLFIVDGLPLNNNSFDQHLLASNLDNRNDDYTNRIADINPDDIQSITVLKGPEATALYGIQAGSGAIIITTKKARTGKLRVMYDNNFKYTSLTRLPDVQKVYDNGTNGQTTATTTTRNLFGARYSDTSKLYDNISNFFRNGFSTKHTLSLEGGMGNTALRGSLSYRNDQGVVPTTSLKSTSGRITMANKVTPKLDLTTTLSYTYSENEKALRGAGGFLQNLLLWPQDYDARNYLNENGSRKKVLASTTAELDNPYFDVYKNHAQDKTGRGTFNLSAVYNIKPWWNITVRGGTDFYSQYGNYFRHPESNLAYTVGGQVEEYEEQFLSLNGVLVNTFTKNIGKFKNTLRIGVADDDWTRRDFSRRGSSLIDSSTAKISNARTVVDSRITGADTLTKKRLQGVFGEFSISYNDIVSLNFTGRNDWTSTLPVEERSFFYPSAGLSFIFSDIIAKNSRVLTFGKLRASFAGTAKDVNPYSNQSVYTTASGQTNGYGMLYDFTNNNKSLYPEKQNTYETGVELKFFKDRISFDGTYFNTKNIGQIVRLVRLSYATGFVLNTSNIANTKNEGYEVSLSVVPVAKNVRWTSTFNFTKNKSKVTYLPYNISEYYNSDTWLGGYRAGLTLNGPITQLTGTTYLRNNAGQILINPTTGLPLGDGTYRRIGDRNPDFTVGFVNKIQIGKKMNISMLIDVRKGGDILNANELWMQNVGLSMKTLDREQARIIPGVLNDGLQNTTTPTPNNIPIIPMYNSTYYTGNLYAVDFVEHNINWLRLRDVTVMYNLGSNALRKLKLFSTASIFLTGTDLFLISNYSGLDPTAGGNNAATPGSGSFGIDYGSQPLPMGILAGLRVQFANK